MKECEVDLSSVSHILLKNVACISHFTGSGSPWGIGRCHDVAPYIRPHWPFAQKVSAAIVQMTTAAILGRLEVLHESYQISISKYSKWTQ